MLLNQNEPIPETFYIFVNQLNPMTYHNLNVTGTFVSAAYTQCSFDQDFAKKYLEGMIDYMPFVQNQQADLKCISPYHLTAINHYSAEYNAELKRKSNFPYYPSRLSATYAFGDYKTCKLVAEKHGWSLSEVKEFRLVQKDNFTRVIKVNMEIVSLFWTANRISSLSPETNDLIWNSYWSGSGSISLDLPTPGTGREVVASGVIWEYLIEGALVSL